MDIYFPLIFSAHSSEQNRCSIPDFAMYGFLYLGLLHLMQSSHTSRQYKPFIAAISIGVEHSLHFITIFPPISYIYHSDIL